MAEEENVLPYEGIDILLTTTKIVTQTTKTDTELAEEQGAGIRPVAVIYQALLNKVKVVEEQLEMGSAELKWLHRQRDPLRLRPDGVIKARVAPQGKPRWCAVFPPTLKGSMI